MLAAGFVSACGADPGLPNVGRIPSMLIKNRSQYELRELRIHAKPGYADVSSVLPEPMGIDDELIYYGLNETWFTVMREKNTMGQLLALTTSEPVEMYRGGAYLLTVFDENFRLENSSYVRPDMYSGLIIGDPGPACEWMKEPSMTTTSTVPCVDQ